MAISPKSYGDRFEIWIIMLTSTAIILSFVGVYLLWQHNTDPCHVMDYTYCPNGHFDTPSTTESNH